MKIELFLDEDIHLHWGIIVSKQLPFRETMSKLLRLLQHNTKETIKNHLEFL